MRSKLSVIVAIAGGLFLALTAPVWGHHAFNAEFDQKKPIKLQGIVKRMEWINPHSWMTIEVKRTDGTVETWEIEAGAPNSMFRRGFNRNSLPAGIEVVVLGYLSKDATKKRANGGSITFSDGRTLFLGGSNPDDPDNKKP